MNADTQDRRQLKSPFRPLIAKATAEREAINARLAELDAQLAELESAEKVWLKYCDAAYATPTVTPDDGIAASTGSPLIGEEFACLSIIDAAQRVLARHEDTGLSYQDVAREAIASGFRAPRSGAVDLERIGPSFYEMMKRHPELFDRDGNLFRLRADLAIDAPDDDQEDSEAEDLEAGQEEGGPSYVEAAIEVRRLLNRPITTGDVADWFIKRGLRGKDRRRYIKNTIYNQLKRSKDFILVGPGQFDLASRKIHVV